MLNPSTADAELDDPTIRRCVRFARDLGYDGIFVGNLFAYRATDPDILKRVSDPIGPHNDQALVDMLSTVRLVICAWGNNGNLQNRDKRVLQLIHHAGHVPYCLSITKIKAPKHPLYIAASSRPIPLI